MTKDQRISRLTQKLLHMCKERDSLQSHLEAILPLLTPEQLLRYRAQSKKMIGSP